MSSEELDYSILGYCARDCVLTEANGYNRGRTFCHEDVYFGLIFLEECPFLAKRPIGTRPRLAYDRENKNLLASFSDEGEIVKYVYGNGLISSYTSGDDSAEEPAVSYYLYDLRGSAEHITDDEGDIVSTYAYSAYGQRTVESGTETPVGYCGRDGVLTEDNGLLYMRARYYAPSLRRFVNQDIVVGDISNSNSLNRYSYVEGNPVTMVDPFGLCAQKSGQTSSVFTSQNIHNCCDILGFILGYGDAFDFANCCLYFSEGDYLNAGISFICVIPIVGDILGKGGKVLVKGIKSLSKADKVVDAAKVVCKYGDEVLEVAVKCGDDVAEVIAKQGDEVAEAIAKNSRDVTSIIQKSESSFAPPGFDEWLNRGELENTIYKAVSDAGVDCYTGITKQSIGARLAQHQNLRKCISDLIPIETNLTRNQARALEQFYIENGPNLLNKINSISKEHRYYSAAKEWALEYIEKNGLPKY